MAVSPAGTLAYFPGPVATSGNALQLAIFDRTGAAEALGMPLGAYSHPRVSPDGTRLAVNVDDGRQTQVWIYGLARSSAARRLTLEGDNRLAEWSADGQRVAFQSTREGDSAIWWQRADGTDRAVRLTRTGADVVQAPFSPAGRRLLFDELQGQHVTIKDLTLADGTITTIATPDSDAPSDATFSPDGKWIAYTVRSEVSPQAIVYVEPYPPTGARYQVSKQEDDGHHAVWSRDGRLPYYTPGPGNRLLSPPVTTAPSFGFGDPVQLQRQRPFVNAPPTTDRTYDVTADGRIVGLRTDVGPDGRLVNPEVEVVLNWFDDLRQRLPAPRHP